jgi:SAM-dependent methyltransferase
VQSSLAAAITSWWRSQRQGAGRFSAARKLIAIGGEFLRDSFPDRRRQRFGDLDYDWEHRVNTTSANVSWQSRLIGLLHSPYQPVEPALFREIMNSLAIDFAQFIFIDIGSGKGRALLLASEYPFHRIVGIELLPELHAIAQENIREFLTRHPRNSLIESVCADATRFAFPDPPLIIFLNNPLPASSLRKFVQNLENSVRSNPRPVIVIYTNPILQEIIAASSLFKKIAGTHQYALFQNA